MIDWSKPVQTRDGRKVRVLCTNLLGEHPIAAAISDYKEGEYVVTRPLSGQHREHAVSPGDLINVPEERWGICYPDGNGRPRMAFETFTNVDAARRFAGNQWPGHYIARLVKEQP